MRRLPVLVICVIAASCLVKPRLTPSGKPMPPPGGNGHMRSVGNGLRCSGERNGIEQWGSYWCESGLCEDYTCVASCSMPMTQNVATGCEQSY